MKHISYGFLGMVMSFLTSAQLTQSIDPTIMQQLINAVVAVIAGVLTGMLSKILHKFFIDGQSQNTIQNQNQTINQLQKTIELQQKGSLSSNRADTNVSNK